MREKLIELVFNAWLDTTTENGCVPTAVQIADYLIDNGVTVQEWIPVAERLPEPFKLVLVCMPQETPHTTVREGFVSKDGVWHSALYDREPDEVTHWMPLPEPPKGD